jgi:hypothetical protein
MTKYWAVLLEMTDEGLLRGLDIPDSNFSPDSSNALIPLMYCRGRGKKGDVVRLFRDNVFYKDFEIGRGSKKING